MKAIFAKIKKKSQNFDMQNNIGEQNQLNPNQSFKLSKDLIVRKNQDGTVIVMRLDESSLFFKIDGIAAKVWGSLVEPKSVSQLVSEFETLYPSNKDQVAQDVPKFLNELINKNLAVVC